MTTPQDLSLAEARVATARARLNGTVESLQAELAPRKLAHEVGGTIASGAESAVRRSVDAARRNPAVAAGAAALLVAVLNRRRIAGALRRLRGKNKPQPTPEDRV